LRERRCPAEVTTEFLVGVLLALTSPACHAPVAARPASNVRMLNFLQFGTSLSPLARSAIAPITGGRTRTEIAHDQTTQPCNALARPGCSRTGCPLND
jgi:hypothetical protein